MEKIQNAKSQLDKVINKARVHLYKPIQIAEILHRHRIKKDFDVNILEEYRTQSRQWRDIICTRFLNRTSTSSARYQDDIFNENAIPPKILNVLALENVSKEGIVEAYIYKCFQNRQYQMINALDYVNKINYNDFYLENFLNLFWHEPGLRRSIDKIFEIVVYSLFFVIIKELKATIKLSVTEESIPLINEFSDFTEEVMNIKPNMIFQEIPATINRVGTTNASDRGLDMWANFGPAIQIKHLSLTKELADDIVKSVSSDKIIIVCKDAEEKIVNLILNQLGLKDKIQSIINENRLIIWYNKALRGDFSSRIGKKLIESIKNELRSEFPTSDQDDFLSFFNGRGYNNMKDDFWN